ncbi:amidohydrolase family protein [Pirellulaceae bacterium SH501]
MDFFKTTRFLCSIAVCVIASSASVSAEEISDSKVKDDSATQRTAYWVGQLYTGSGPAIPDALVVVQQGKIVAAGPRSGIELNKNDKIVDRRDLVLVPGLVIADTNLIETGNDEPRTFTPENRAIDAFDFFKDRNELLAAGITSVHISTPSNRLMSGQGAVVKLAGQDASARVIDAAESMKVVLSNDALTPPTIYEPPVGAVSVDRPLKQTQPQIGASLAEVMAGLRAIFEGSENAESEDLSVAALRKWLSDKHSFRIYASSASELQAALEISNWVPSGWYVIAPKGWVDPIDKSMLASENFRGAVLKSDWKPGLIRNPPIPRQEDRASLEPWEVAKKMKVQGVVSKISMQPGSDSDLPSVWFLAKQLMRGGLTLEECLATLTANPSKLLGVDGRVGQIAKGLDADFVFLSNKPFEDGVEVLSTYVDGEEVYQKNAPSESIVISASKVYTPTGVLSDAKVTLSSGKIRSVGTDATIPSKSRRLNFPQGVVVPGFVDAGSELGLGLPLADSIPLETKLAPLLAYDDPAIQLARQGGMTTALLSSSRLPSPVIAFKLLDRPRALKDPVAIRFEVSGNLSMAESNTRRSLLTAKQYADAWNRYDESMKEYQTKLQAYEVEKKKYDEAVKKSESKEPEKSEKSDKPAEGSKPSESAKPAESGKPVDGAKQAESTKPAEQGKSPEPAKDESGKAEEKPREPEKPKEPEKPRANASLEPYRELFAGKIVAIVEVDDVRTAELAVKLFHTEYKLPLVLAGGKAVWEAGETLAKEKIPVLLGPSLSFESKGETINLPAEMALHNIPFLVQSKATTGAKQLSELLSYSAFLGLSKGKGLAALTSNPSDVLKLPSIGAIEEGKDADLVVLSGDPLDISTEVLAVVIDGTVVYLKDAKE